MGRTVRVPDVGTLPMPEMLARLALLDDQLKVVLPPRGTVILEAVNELILGELAESRTVTVIVRGVARPVARLTSKR